METTISINDALVLIALTLLVIVTGGVGYLTWVDWSDRRRLQQDQRELRRKSRR